MIFGIDKDIVEAFLIFLAVILLNGFIWFKLFYRAIKSRKEALKELQKPVKDTTLVFKNAKVLSKNAYINYKNSIKLPEHKTVFKVSFSIGNSSKEFEVNRKVFDRISENEFGTLIIKNGGFYDFQKR